MSDGSSGLTLIAADDVAKVSDLQLLLEQEGHTVVAVRSLTAIFESAGSRPLELLFVDVGLAGNDAVELCRELHSDLRTAQIPLILLAPHAGPRERMRAIDLGATDCLGWSSDAVEIRLRVREQLHLQHLKREKAKLQQELALARVSNLTVDIARGVAHNYLNLLTGIQGYVGLLELALLDVPELQDYLQQVHDLVGRATAMTGDLARCARVAKMSCEEVPLAELAAELFRPLSEWSGKWRLHIEEISGSGVLLCNPGQLRHVMTLLLTNAAESMPAGGTIRVKGTVEPPLSTFPVSSTGDALFRIAVQDHGVGLPVELVQRVFEPFFSTKAVVGAGLGLAVARAIVLGHRGDITFTSRPGRGSRVVIDLPMFRPTPSLPLRSRHPGRTKATNRKM